MGDDMSVSFVIRMCLSHFYQVSIWLQLQNHRLNQHGTPVWRKCTIQSVRQHNKMFTRYYPRLSFSLWTPHHYYSCITVSLSHLLLISGIQCASQSSHLSPNTYITSPPPICIYMQCTLMTEQRRKGEGADAVRHFHECQDSLWRLRVKISSSSHAHTRM